MEEIIVGLLRVLCPHLKRMAAKTANPVDDIVVNIICMIAGYEPEKEE
ncbi:MAG: hypothetical protein JRC53_03935 [Deltaproteobacteria bacterium]|nr:hypothetical protein [Deltaproteobacteria bacterium]